MLFSCFLLSLYNTVPHLLCWEFSRYTWNQTKVKTTRKLCAFTTFFTMWSCHVKGKNKCVSAVHCSFAGMCLGITAVGIIAKCLMSWTPAWWGFLCFCGFFFPSTYLLMKASKEMEGLKTMVIDTQWYSKRKKRE